jgi:EMC6
MIDPMANLDAAPGAPEPGDEKDVIDIACLQYNLLRVEQIRSVMGIASGCVAGIFGLTGLEGLGKYYES